MTHYASWRTCGQRKRKATLQGSTVNIIQADPRSLIPYELNNRKHPEQQINRIANSISEFGFNQPIIVDEQNIVLVGHGRLAAALKLGLDKVPVLQVLGLTEAKKKAYRILDNKLQNDSEWDFQNLELELAHLEDLGFELEPWGLDELVPKGDEPEVYEDGGGGALPDEPYIKEGDLIELGSHTVWCIDCREAEPLPIKANLWITDPPYGVSYVGKTKDALTIENDDLNEDELAGLWTAATQYALDNLTDGAGCYASVPSEPLNFVFLKEWIEKEIYRQQLVWDKGQMVLGHSDYHYRHEPILYGWKPGAAHYFISDRTKTSMLCFDKPSASKDHPTTKPIALWVELISNSTKKGQVVLDTFLGSGTTILACDQLNRICYGMEISPAYCQVILERYKAHCEKVGKPFVCKINGEPFIKPEV